MSPYEIGQAGKMTIEPAAIIMMATKLFPEYYQLEEIERQIQALQWERAKLFDANLHGTNDFTLKVIETNKLRCVILDFENEQSMRVKTIIEQQDDALGRIKDCRRAKLANTVLNGMPLLDEHSFMKWECDTEVGDVIESKDEFDLSGRLDSAIQFHSLTKNFLVIAKAEEELEELKERFNFEAMLHASLVAAMEGFVEGARLAHHEATLWAVKKENDPRREIFSKMTSAEFEELQTEVFAWMRAAAIHFIGLEQQAGLGGKDPSTNGPGDTSTNATNTGHDKTPLFPSKDMPVNSWEKLLVSRPNYCYFCQKFGHTNDYCPDLYPEEEQPNFCDICDKEGHTEERCWVVHPELKLQWVAQQEQKQQRLACHHCGKKGHVRRWCHLLH